jgi:ubiquinone/menaquinone biosynthesis C-methylase UbiE
MGRPAHDNAARSLETYALEEMKPGTLGERGGPKFPSRRLATFYEFVLSHLESPPGRVFEVGCGDGELALALSHAGDSMTAIDPEAPDGAIFRRTRLEDFADGDLDAVVASVSLHHVKDVGIALDKIVDLVRPRGLLILEEFAKERLTGPTARWYYHERQATAAAGAEEASAPDDFETWMRQWVEEHTDVHSLRS